VTSFIGIVNMTTDSFSDGGKFVTVKAAIEQGERLLAQGADWIDLGAESSNPNGNEVPVSVQIERLVPVVKHFGAKASVDTHRAEVMQAVLEVGAGMINDITALRDPTVIEVLAGFDCKVVLMHSRASDARAEKERWSSSDPVAEIISFFQHRLPQIPIDKGRLILDPGMGFFLSSNSESSVAVLRDLPRLKTFGLPLYISTSRKAFVAPKVQPAERGPGTLASELWALDNGAEFLRTHEVGAIGQAWKMWQRLRTPSRE